LEERPGFFFFFRDVRLAKEADVRSHAQKRKQQNLKRWEVLPKTLTGIRNPEETAEIFIRRRSVLFFKVKCEPN
jgi:hypothetical protein